MEGNMSDNTEKKKPSLMKRSKDNAYLIALFCLRSALAMQMMTENQYIYRKVASLYATEVTSSENSTSNSTSAGGTCGAVCVSVSSAGENKVRFHLLPNPPPPPPPPKKKKSFMHLMST